MTKANELRLQLIEDLVGQYMCWYDDMNDPAEFAESLVFTISEIFNDNQIVSTFGSYQFPDIFEKSKIEDAEFEELYDDTPTVKMKPVRKPEWPSEADLIEEVVNE